MVQFWEVVGGADRGGILVRQGEDLASPKCEGRLSTGALVEEVKLAGDRLGYKRLTGSGPKEGWVSISLPGKTLMARTDKRPPGKEEPAPAPKPAPKPRQSEEPRPAPVREPTRSAPASGSSGPPSAPSGSASRAPAAAPKPAAVEVPPISDEPIHIGDFGEGENRSKFRVRAIPAVKGVPAGGLVGTIAWDEPMGRVHDALLETLGVQRGSLSMGWRGRNMQDDLSLLETDTIGASKGAKQRAREMTVEMVFMLGQDVTIQPLARSAPAPAAAAASAAESSQEPAPSPAQPAEPPAAAAPRPAAPRPYASQLEQLAGMGFADEALVLPLLEAKRGNVQAVVDALLG